MAGEQDPAHRERASTRLTLGRASTIDGAAAEDALARSRRVDDERATGCRSPTMWGPSIVGFGSYHYVYESGREGDAPIVGFAPRGREMTLYVLADFARRDALLAQARQAPHRQVVPLHPAARRRRPDGARAAGGGVGRGSQEAIPDIGGVAGGLVAALTAVSAATRVAACRARPTAATARRR